VGPDIKTQLDMINALSIDLEYWWSIELLKGRVPHEKDDQVEESLRPIMALLEKYEVNATFFVLGSLAEKYPEVVAELHEMGHEIASHGYSHKTLYDMNESVFEEEIKKSLSALGRYKPKGFRAPTFSLDNRTLWALGVLEKHGFTYDSSVFPIKTHLYGVPDAPLGMYKPSRDDITKEDANGKIIEIPMTVVKKIGKNVPISGGFYFRALPLWFLRSGIKKVNKERPAIIYLHPWETYDLTPRIRMSQTSRFITYCGIGSTLKKLDILLKEFEFGPMKDLLVQGDFIC
jgi:peptidoglycan-N-acetylglucosamine deacetylase